MIFMFSVRFKNSDIAQYIKVVEGTFTDGESIRLNAEVQAGMYYIIVGEAVQKISVVR